MEMNNPSAATANTAWLEERFLLYGSVTLPVGTLYVNDIVNVPPVMSCGRVKTAGAGGYYIAPHATLSGKQTKIVQLESCPLFRVQGVGFIMEEPVQLEGDGTSACFEIEGRQATGIASGRHHFRNLCLYNWTKAFDCLAGYYNTSEVFVPDENHADNSSVTNCEFFNVGTLFHSTNQQALNWYFKKCVWNQIGEWTPSIIADIVRGGCITLDELVVNATYVTLFRTEQYSQNNARLVSKNMFIDRIITDEEDQYFKVLDYNGTPETASFKDWFMDVEGWSGVYFDPASFIDAPLDLPQTHFNIDIKTKYTS